MRFAWLFLLLVAAQGIAFAQSPREQLQQLTAELQRSPNDNALRERIIKLAQQVKPAPALPEAAQRSMARGNAAFRGAQNPAEFQLAVREFEQATLHAPWLGDAYFNLALAQDKAGNYDAALRSIALARLALPDSQEAKNLGYEIEYRKEKARDAARAPDIAKLQGIWHHKDDPVTWYYRVEVVGDTIRFSVYRTELRGRVPQDSAPGSYGEYRLKAEKDAFKGTYVEGGLGNHGGCNGRESPASATVSPDGREMAVTLKRMFGPGVRNGMVDPRTCDQTSVEQRFTLRKQ